MPACDTAAKNYAAKIYFCLSLIRWFACNIRWDTLSNGIVCLSSVCHVPISLKLSQIEP